MGYMSKDEKTKTLDQVAGAELIDRPGGGEWKIKVFTLGELWKFHRVLADVMTDPRAASWIRFFQLSLEDPAPGPWVKLRRALGLPDFRAGTLARQIPARRAKEVRDRIVQANLDMTFDEFAAMCEENVKKKTASGEAPTGGESPGRCSSSGDSCPGNCSR